MSDAVMDEMALIVREAMASCPGRSVKEQLAYASRQLKIEFRRVRGIHYREARAILAIEADRLRAWYREYTEQEAVRLEARAAELRARSKALRERLNDFDLAASGEARLRRG